MNRSRMLDGTYRTNPRMPLNGVEFRSDHPPAVVTSRESDAIRVAMRDANSRAIIPPMDTWSDLCIKWVPILIRINSLRPINLNNLTKRTARKTFQNAYNM